MHSIYLVISYFIGDIWQEEFVEVVVEVDVQVMEGMIEEEEEEEDLMIWILFE